jgi:glycosyltransferase involved in cell wall biosynthesis
LEQHDSDIELSVVMPCLNEADTLEICITKVLRIFDEHKIVGEVVIADNGSTDGSQEIANRLGARVEDVPERGYGAALMGGIMAARGHFVLMGDADDSYDFLEIPKFLEKLREGFDLVQGCRLPRGGGTVLPNAMPFLHRWLGNPMLSAMVRGMFHAPVTDIYCGMRGFRKDLYLRLDQRCTGMEFATEMIIKSTLYGAKIAEVPITLHPDGRKAHGPHLRTFRDGWRTVRFFMMYSPRWLFLFPGMLLIFSGVVGYSVALSSTPTFGINFGPHTLLVASLSFLLGYQSLLFAIFTKTFAISEGLMPADPRMDRFYDVINLEKGLVLGVLSFVIGLGLISHTANEWRAASYGPLDYELTLRSVIPGVTLAALGFQTMLSGFFVSILGMSRR